MLTEADLTELTAFRRALHQQPELSGAEAGTARRIAAALADLHPARILSGLGGQGVAAVFEGRAPGPTVLFRAELDGLPIAERTDVPWRSQVAGAGHLCGHDGHMAMLLALGRQLWRRPVARGRAVLMFQPAEETGAGARAVVADPRYREIAPDWAFAIHNLPGSPLGHLELRAGLVNCASTGLIIAFGGRTAHAASPEDGVAPTLAVAEMLTGSAALGHGSTRAPGFRLATVTHARIGAPSFGIAPGDATIHLTLRSGDSATMAELTDAARALAEAAARRHGLALEITECETFAPSINAPEAVQVARDAATALGLGQGSARLPMRASEDFGLFGAEARAAMLWVGAGETCAGLHAPDYDFPDALIPIGAAIFERIARDLLGGV